jgi:hypothetical protein
MYPSAAKSYGMNSGVAKRHGTNSTVMTRSATNSPSPEPGAGRGRRGAAKIRLANG